MSADEQLQTLLAEVRALRALVAERLPDTPSAVTAVDAAPRPLTAQELCKRWGIESATPQLMLHRLAAKLRQWGLRPLRGTRGWSALYDLSEVLHAESYGAGKERRRRHGPASYGRM